MRIGADAQAIRLTSDALSEHLVPVPKQVAETCPNCRTWLPADGEGGLTPAECENCVEVREALGRAPLPIALVSLYRKPSTLRDILTRYKGRDDEDDPFDPAHVENVRAMLGRFILEHGDEITAKFSDVDALVVVPSTDRQPPHPLEAVIRSLALDMPVLPLLSRGPGDMGFRKPHRDGFQARQTDRPHRVLLVDDVYTTGSRLNSAAAALEGADHHTAGAMVLARRINPDYNDDAARLWERASNETFDWQKGPWV
jgi:predicted amidophosphoribosyltransferase